MFKGSTFVTIVLFTLLVAFIIMAVVIVSKLNSKQEHAINNGILWDTALLYGAKDECFGNVSCIVSFSKLARTTEGKKSIECLNPTVANAYENIDEPCWTLDRALKTPLN